MLDLHLHIWAHRPGTPPPTLDQIERYCEAAAAKGISQIAITEHSHRFERIIDDVLPHWRRRRTGLLADATDHVIDVERGGDLDTYVSTILDAQLAGLPILLGLEVDYLPGAMPAMAELLADYPFDVLLGSVHWLDEWLFDAYGNETFAREWQARPIDDVYEQYVDSVLDLAQSGVADVLAHLDVIKVAGHRTPNQLVHEHRLVEGLLAANTVVEISSAGLRKPVQEIYPGPTLLDALVAQGVGFTTASDGHTAQQIGMHYDVLEQELDARAIGALITFERRVRTVVSR